MYPAYAVSEVATNPHSNFVSTRDTISLMRQLVTESISTPQIEALAQKLSMSIGRVGRTPTTEEIARKVFWWVKTNVRLVEDEWILVDQLGQDREEILHSSGKELLLSPAYLVLQNGADRQGDCDDFSTLTATLLIRMGIPRANIYFCTVAADPVEPRNYSHVYVKLRREDGMFIALDCSHGSYPGWETQERYSEMLWPV